MKKLKNKKSFVYNAKATNRWRLLKAHLLAYFKGWKLRIAMSSKSVKNAVSTFLDY